MSNIHYYLDWTWGPDMHGEQRWYQKQYWSRKEGDPVVRKEYASYEDARTEAVPWYKYGPAHFRIEIVEGEVSRFDEFMVKKGV